MRRLCPCTLMVLAACGGDAEPSREDTCQAGLRIHGEALAAAIERAPACVDDSDCISMPEEVSCPGSISISLCDVAVHRLVPEYYDREAVVAAMCEAAEGSDVGCSVNAACREHGEPECVAGECVFAE